MPSTAIKVIGNSFESMGTGGTKKDNSAVAISGIILTTADFNFATVALAATQSEWVDGIKEKNVFPFFGLDSYEDQSTDATIYESATQRRKLLRLGKKRFMFSFDLPLDAHRAMQSYRNGDLRMFIVEEDGKIRFYNQGDAVWGFTTSLVNPGKMKEVAPDGATPALSSLYIDMENFREWDEQGDFFTPTWEATSLEPLIPVDITKADGSVGAIAASALAFTFAVGSRDGWTSAGVSNRVGIKGLMKADFAFTTTAGATQDAAVDTLTDNADGTYTAACTGFATGFVDLVAVATRVVTDASLLVDSNGQCAITVT